MKKIRLDENDKIGTPFKVPEGYFDQLNKEILSRTVEVADEKITKQVWLTPVRMSIAAAITIIMAVSGVLFFNNDSSTTPEDFLAEVSSEDIMLYLSDNNISEQELLDEIEFNDYQLDWEESSPLDELELNDGALDEYILEYDITENI